MKNITSMGIGDFGCGFLTHLSVGPFYYEGDTYYGVRLTVDGVTYGASDSLCCGMAETEAEVDNIPPTAVNISAGLSATYFSLADKEIPFLKAASHCLALDRDELPHYMSVDCQSPCSLHEIWEEFDTFNDYITDFDNGWEIILSSRQRQLLDIEGEAVYRRTPIKTVLRFVEEYCSEEDAEFFLRAYAQDRLCLREYDYE